MAVKVMNQVERTKLRQQLPALQFNRALDFEQCSDSLREYFQRYHFDQLVDETHCNYHVGRAQLAGYECVAHTWFPDRFGHSDTVVITHGLFDHAGLYLHLVRRLLLQHYTVVLVDFPGHGLSEGRPASIGDFSEYAAVLAATMMLLKRSERFAEVSLIGQSTGASAILYFVMDQAYDHNIKCISLLAPLVRPRNWPLVRVSYTLAKYFVKDVPRKFTVNSHHQEFCDFLKNEDPLQVRRIPLLWIRAMITWVDYFQTQTRLLGEHKINQRSIPVLIIQGATDDTVDWKYNLEVIKKHFKYPSQVIVNDMAHHIVNEAPERREFAFTALLKFLEQKVVSLA